MNIQNVRDLFPIVNKKIYMDHASFSPCSIIVEKAIRNNIQEWMNRDSDYYDFLRKIGEAKDLFSSLINARSNEIAFMPNTSYGINAIAHSLEIPSGSNVVTDEFEYPSVVYPWLCLQKRNQITVKFVPHTNGKFLISDFEKKVDDKTSVVAISHVKWHNGFKYDLQSLSEIAHRHGAYLLVDAIQSVGAQYIDVKRSGVDFLMTGGYKWLMGPFGTGFLYVTKELISELTPIFTGWLTPPPSEWSKYENKQLSFSENADRFEIGTVNFLGFLGLSAAIRLILEYGQENIEKRIMKLLDYLIDGLNNLKLTIQSPLESEYRSSIINIKFPKLKAEKVDLKLRSKKIFISAPYLEGIRISPHFYNTQEEIDVLLTELKKIVNTQL